MDINYYRQANAQGYLEAWKSCQINADTDLSGLTAGQDITAAGPDNYTACKKCDNPLTPKEIEQSINTSLTLPHHQNQTPTAPAAQ